VPDGSSARRIGAFSAPDLTYTNGVSEEGWTGFQPLFEVKAH